MVTQLSLLPEDLLCPHNLKIFLNINLFSELFFCKYTLNAFSLTTLWSTRKNLCLLVCFGSQKKSVCTFKKHLLKPSGPPLVLQAALALLVPHITKECALDKRNLSSPAAPASPNPWTSILPCAYRRYPGRFWGKESGTVKRKQLCRFHYLFSDPTLSRREASGMQERVRPEEIGGFVTTWGLGRWERNNG